MFQLHGWEALLFYFLAFMTLVMAVLNAAVAVPLYHILDKFKGTA